MRNVAIYFRIAMYHDDKLILDACCGSRMFWFDKQHPNALFVDKREMDCDLCDGRKLSIHPDVVADFTHLPFDDGAFKMVIFDPPHLVGAGKTSWLAKKYGVLHENWRPMIADGFAECWRVLADYGTLIFKWNEQHIKLKDILATIPQKPLIGNRSNARGNTIWLVFIKNR